MQYICLQEPLKGVAAYEFLGGKARQAHTSSCADSDHALVSLSAISWLPPGVVTERSISSSQKASALKCAADRRSLPCDTSSEPFPLIRATSTLSTAQGA